MTGYTRLLAYVLEMFDLPFRAVPPPLVMRQFVMDATLFLLMSCFRHGRLRGFNVAGPKRWLGPVPGP